MEPALSLEPKDTDAAIKRLSGMPGIVGSYLSAFPEKAATKLSPDDFSITEHICHLRDLEIEGYLARVRRILAENHPLLPDFEGGRIAKERDYNSQDATDALHAFASAREESVRLLRSLEAAQFQKTGNLSGVGAVNIRELVNLMLEHDQEHINELKELLKHF